MPFSIKDVLESKGITASDHILKTLESRWQSINDLRLTIPQLSTSAIALRNDPRGEDESD